MKRMPQPIPYQGSKRNIAKYILAFFPKDVDTLIEPFAGSAAVSVAAAYYHKASRFHLNDLNQPLMALLEMLISQPARIAADYERLWHSQMGREREFYDEARDQFNQTHRPDYFLYLLARCVKASVRYNAEGAFNQSPDNRRRGRRPKSMRKEIFMFSSLLQDRTTVTDKNYRQVLTTISEADLVYMDPPYQGTSRGKDPRYYQSLDFDELVSSLETLNHRQIRYILSYDGRRGKQSYGKRLPKSLELYRFEIEAGRSTQSTLLGGEDITYESLYISPALVSHLDYPVSEAKNDSDASSISLPPTQLELGLV